MNRIATEYAVADGKVDYMACFRKYLTGDAHTQSTTTTPTASTTNIKAKIKVKLDEDHTSTANRSLCAHHPWEFDYKRDKSKNPYWAVASSLPREIQPIHSIHPPLQLSTNSNALNNYERNNLKNLYPANVLLICSKCYQTFLPIWRDLRTEFKRSQVSTHKGYILNKTFIGILQHFDVKLSKTEIGTILRVFRGLSMQDVVNFDEFLRVCLLVKDNPSLESNHSSTSAV